ncbi:MAG: hypothetical protein RL698_1508 [Pseudomonadota bacterium]
MDRVRSGPMDRRPGRELTPGPTGTTSDDREARK